MPTYIELLEERFIGQFECGEPIGGLEGLVEKAGLVHGWLHVAVIPVVEGSCNMYVAACNVHISLVKDVLRLRMTYLGHFLMYHLQQR